MEIHNSSLFEYVLGFERRTQTFCPLFAAPVSAGFPSPADDYIEEFLDLNECLVQHPAATFFARVRGNSMEGVGIRSGDILIIDRALFPHDSQIVIALLDGEYTVKRFRRQNRRVFLVAENPVFQAIEITSERQFEVWGVVTFVIHPI